MSDVSVLSHEYRTASSLSQAINESLIRLKKVRLGVAGAEAITPHQITESRHVLADLIKSLLAMLDPTGTKVLDTRSDIRWSGALVARLRETRRGDLDDFIDDLERVVSRLDTNPATLTSEDLSVLDQLSAAASAEASRVFRRLMHT